MVSGNIGHVALRYYTVDVGMIISAEKESKFYFNVRTGNRARDKIGIAAISLVKTPFHYILCPEFVCKDTWNCAIS